MKMSNDWFYSNPPKIFQILLIYVRGDGVVLFPFILVLVVLGVFSVQIMLVAASFLVTFRALGETIYWLLQQFGPRKYRPYDFGLKDLDNNAIYILYQLWSLVLMTLGATALSYLLFFQK